MWHGGRGTSFHVTGPGWCCRGAAKPTSHSQPGFSHRELAMTGKITRAGVNFVSHFQQISGVTGTGWWVGRYLSLRQEGARIQRLTSRLQSSGLGTQILFFQGQPDFIWCWGSNAALYQLSCPQASPQLSLADKTTGFIMISSRRHRRYFALIFPWPSLLLLPPAPPSLLLPPAPLLS